MDEEIDDNFVEEEDKKEDFFTEDFAADFEKLWVSFVKVFVAWKNLHFCWQWME